jgi:hypothetical protein
MPPFLPIKQLLLKQEQEFIFMSGLIVANKASIQVNGPQLQASWKMKLF